MNLEQAVRDQLNRYEIQVYFTKTTNGRSVYDVVRRNPQFKQCKGQSLQVQAEITIALMRTALTAAAKMFNLDIPGTIRT